VISAPVIIRVLTFRRMPTSLACVNKWACSATDPASDAPPVRSVRNTGHGRSPLWLYQLGVSRNTCSWPVEFLPLAAIWPLSLIAVALSRVNPEPGGIRLFRFWNSPPLQIHARQREGDQDDTRLHARLPRVRLLRYGTRMHLSSGSPHSANSAGARHTAIAT